MSSSNTPSAQWQLAGVYSCFLLSGFAALLYQVAWMRQFSAVFGTSEYSVATVLSAYMGGLAIGALMSGRILRLIQRPILFYGFLEGAIALSALMVPLLIQLASGLYLVFAGNLASPPEANGIGQASLYLLFAFLILLIPTACMGATLPVLSRFAVNRDEQVTSRIGSLYGLNTAGAIFGALAAGFLLLPALGLRGTVWVGVFINLVVFAIAVLIHRAIKPTAEIDRVESDASSDDLSEDIETASAENSKQRGSSWILPLIMISGMVSFAYEVLWTRLFAHFLGGSVAAFSVMLAGFLTGIALGSALVGYFIKSRRAAVYAFVGSQLLIALGSVAIFYLLIAVSDGNPERSFLLALLYFGLLPATLFIGVTFPLAVRIYAPNFEVAAFSASRVFGLNTIGAILGATLAVLILIPTFEYHGSLKLLILLNLCIAFGAALIARLKVPVTVSVAILVLIVAISFQPSTPFSILKHSPFAGVAGGEVYHTEVGRAATVLVHVEDGAYRIRSNGLPEATALPIGSAPLFDNQRMLGALPVFARPDADNALIIGLGAGSAVTGVPPTVSNIDVIELEPAIVRANELISEQRKYRPLQDPRVNLIVNDARSGLARTSKNYDVIVSQPSHPWTAGASHLYTEEFVQLVGSRLQQNGVFLQWINTQFVDEELLKSLFATLLSEFDNARVYQWSPQVLFILASDGPLDIERSAVSTNRPFIDAPQFYQELGVAVVEDLVAALMMDEAAVADFASDATPITDNFNRLAMHSESLWRRGEHLSFEELSSIFQKSAPVLDSRSWLHAELGDSINFVRVHEKLTQLSLHGFKVPLIDALAESGNSQVLNVAAKQARDRGDFVIAEALLEQAVLETASNQARYALVQPWLGALGAGESEQQLPEAIRIVAESTSGAARSVLDARAFSNVGDYQRVAELDAALSRSTPADAWYLESVKLRVDWRNRVTTPELRTELASQSWQILDLAIANVSDPELYILRVASSLRSGSFAELKESLRAYIKNYRFLLQAIKSEQVSVAGINFEQRLQRLELLIEAVSNSVPAQSNSEQSLAELRNQLIQLHSESAELL